MCKCQPLGSGQHTAPPGGETYGQLQARAVAFLEELVALARVDGRIDANEKNMLVLVAGHLGLELAGFLKK